MDPADMEDVEEVEEVEEEETGEDENSKGASRPTHTPDTRGHDTWHYMRSHTQHAYT